MGILRPDGWPGYCGRKKKKFPLTTSATFSTGGELPQSSTERRESFGGAGGETNHLYGGGQRGLQVAEE